MRLFWFLGFKMNLTLLWLGSCVYLALEDLKAFLENDEGSVKEDNEEENQDHECAIGV